MHRKISTKNIESAIEIIDYVVLYIDTSMQAIIIQLWATAVVIASINVFQQK